MNKVVLITGASSGIGESLKNKYQNDGDIVINLSLDVKAEDANNYMLDVSNREMVFKTIDKVFNLYGKIDVLVNCAGYGVFGALELLDEKKCKNIFDVNFFGSLWTCQAVLKYMKRGGKIINISSAGAIFCLPFRAMYSASKVAVLNMSFGLRMELKKSGIDVTCICPGDVKTNFSKNRDITLNTNTKYGEQISKSCKKIQDGEHKRMDKEYACKKIYKICTKNKYKAMYIVGGKYKFLNFMQRFISKNKLLNIISKKY